MDIKKAILWDLDGTILDSLTVMIEIQAEIFPTFGIPLLDRERVRHEFHGSLEDSMIRMTDNYHDQASLLAAFHVSQQKHYEDPVFHICIQDAIELFYKEGYKQAIVTSRGNIGRGTGGAHAIVENTGLGTYISAVISADETVKHKPDPEPLLLALEKLGVSPERAVMIGDQPVDAQAAHAAGTHSILIDHENTEQSQAAMRAQSPDALCGNSKEIIEAVIRLFSA